MHRIVIYAGAAISALAAVSASAGSLTANMALTNNYLWRGLTQTANDAAVSGGLDYAAKNGFHAGTWVSNVHFAPGDAFSFENDLYVGYAGGDKVTYDVGYIYYNYDAAAHTDFGEVYGTIGAKGLSAGLHALTGTELTGVPGRDYGFRRNLYLSIDYRRELANGAAVTLHAGHYSGDFNQDFNAVPGDYSNYGVSLSKRGFSFSISDTNIQRSTQNSAGNGSIKFVVAYKIDIDL